MSCKAPAINSIPSSPSNKPSLSMVNHPLFHMAFVDKVQQKIPFINRIMLLVGENYSKLKSGSGWIGLTVGQIENQIISIVTNVVQHVPKQPVEIMDRIACQGLEIVVTKVDSLTQSSKVIRDKVINIPHLMMDKVIVLGSFETLYRSLDIILNIVESSLDYLLSTPHPLSPQPSKERPFDRIIERLRRFSKHFRHHLENYAKGHEWFCQMMLILNPPQSADAKTITNEMKSISDKALEKEDTKQVVYNGELSNKSKSNENNHHQSTNISEQMISKILPKPVEDINYQQQVFAVVDQIVNHKPNEVQVQNESQLNNNQHNFEKEDKSKTNGF